MPQDWFAQFEVVTPKTAPKSAPADWFAQFEVPAAPVRRPAATTYTTARPEDFMPDTSGSTVGRVASGAWEMLNPITMVQGLGRALASPIDTAAHLVQEQIDQGKRALEYARGGQYVQALGHGAAAVVPVVGPVAAGVGQDLAEGDVAGGVGRTAGLLTGVVAPGAIGRRVPAAVRTPVLAARDPVSQAAVEAGRRAGVPIDAATATGNRAIGAFQHIADRSLGGSLIAERAAEAQARGLATMGERLVAQGHPLPVTAEQAGVGVRAGVQQRVGAAAGQADTAYDALRQIEADPQFARTVQTGTRVETVPQPTGAIDAAGRPITQAVERTVPVTQRVALPVAIAPVKAALEPVYRDLLRQSELTPLQGAKGRALVALDRLLQAPDAAPLSAVDGALSDLKAFLRKADGAPLDRGQSVIAQAVQQLDAQVQATVRQAGPRAQQALQAGRAATIEKWTAADVLDALSDEGVGVVRRLTAREDSAIGQLRAVAKQAPAELPAIGRAVLDDLLTQATAEGGFSHGVKIANDWAKLGLQTKRLLYQDPAYIRDLDNFFHLSRMMAKNANPSGTAHVMAAGQTIGAVAGSLTGTIEPMTAIATLVGPATVSKFLHSPGGVKLLTQGIRIPIGNRAARAAWAAEVYGFANKQGIATNPSGSQRQPAEAR